MGRVLDSLEDATRLCCVCVCLRACVGEERHEALEVVCLRSNVSSTEAAPRETAQGRYSTYSTRPSFGKSLKPHSIRNQIVLHLLILIILTAEPQPRLLKQHSPSPTAHRPRPTKALAVTPIAPTTPRRPQTSLHSSAVDPILPAHSVAAQLYCQRTRPSHRS